MGFPSRCGSPEGQPDWYCLPALVAILLLSVCRSALAQTDGAPEESTPAPDVEIRFEGNEAFSDAYLWIRLAGQFAELREAGAPAFMADDLAFAVETLYRRRGYPFVEVTFSLTPGPAERGADEGPPAVTFRITEGERIVIAEPIQIVGNTGSLPVADLLACFEPLREGVLGTGDLLYVAEGIATARSAVASRYRRAGYRDIVVLPPDVTFNREEGTATVVVTVREGPRYRLSTVEVLGPYDGLEADLAAALGVALKVDLEVPEGRALEERARGAVTFRARPRMEDRPPYTQRMLLLARSVAKTFYQDRGHYAVEVRAGAREDSRTGAVALQLAIDPGPVYTVGELRIEDPGPFYEPFLRGLWDLNAGDRFSPARERQTYRVLLRTGLIEDMTIDRQLDHTNRTVGYTLSVEGKPSLWLRVGCGYNDVEGLTGYLEVGEDNLFGVGRRASLRLGGALNTQTEGITLPSSFAELMFQDPWAFGDRWPISATAFYRKRETPNFTTQDIGFEIGLEHIISAPLRIGLFLELTDTRSFDVAPGATSDDQLDLGILSFRLQYDARIPRFNPRTGMTHGFSIRYFTPGTLGEQGEKEFIRVSLEGALFTPIGETSLVLGIAYCTEFNRAFRSEEDIPIQYRLFSGGPDSVRSFKEQGLRLWDTPTPPEGGVARTLLSLELRMPLVGVIDGALFADAGNLAPDLESYFNHFRFAIGGGARLLLPLLIIRADAAWNPYPRNQEDRWVFHLALGYSF